MLDRLVAFPPVRKVNSAWFRYRTNRWRLDPRFLDGPDVPIDRPVFLIGTQNGGLTLLSRILHRHRDALSASGDWRYWAGEDEIQDAFADILPEDFGWRRLDLPGYPDRDHSWVYANDTFLAHYRRGAGAGDDAAAARYRRILRAVIRQHGGAGRLIDKSQSLTLRVDRVHAALADSPPFFVLLTRDPYAVIWSQVTRNRVLAALDLPLDRKVALAAQHWRNSMAAALEDAAANPAIRLRHWRFEDLLAEPDRVVTEVCAFAELPWQPDILPSAADRIPFGSRSDAFNRRKWHPLRPDVNARYLRDIPPEACDIVTETCGALIARLGYDALSRDDASTARRPSPVEG